MTTTGRQLISTLNSDNTMVLSLEEKTFPEPKGNQVLVKMEAAPINPSDLFLMTTGVDFENATFAAGKVTDAIGRAKRSLDGIEKSSLYSLTSKWWLLFTTAART